MSLISINGNELDPLNQTHHGRLAALSLHSEDASRSNYILIMVFQLLLDDQRQELMRYGAQILEYVSNNTYLCSYKNSSLMRLRSLPYVAWVNTYLEQFVVQSSLKLSTPVANTTSALAAVPKTSNLQKVDIIFHHDVDPNDDAVKLAVARAARVDPDSLTVSARKIRLNVQQQYLDDLAAIDTVYLIHQVHPVKLYNNKAYEIMDCGIQTKDGSEYHGEGQVVAVSDTGFDTGSTTDTHPAFAGRVKQVYDLGRPGRADDPDGHGTHVAGSVLGDGNSSTMGGKITGTAPKATLVLQSLLDSWGGLGGLPSDLGDLFGVPYKEHGARVHSNSWGSSSSFGQIRYESSAREIDQFVWEHPDMVIVFAAGNDGHDYNWDGVIDPRQIGAQSAAKNCITVGASENNRPEVHITYGFRWPSDPFRTDPMADHPEGMAAFSSRGPTKEGRIKPDVVAPGTAILSPLSRKAQQSSQYGESSDPQWLFLAGTSMAAPLVSGCAAVIREALIKNGTPNPTAALVKALLINGAMELPGQYVLSEAGPSPNNNSGWGLVNLKNSIILKPMPEATGLEGFKEGGPLRQGEGDNDYFSVNIPKTTAGSSVLKVTLVWSDPPGAQLQNDLDLIVRASDGKERHGNMGEKTGFDRENNVEQVVWSNIPEGDAQVIVRAHRIARQDAPQPYAVAWSINRPLKYNPSVKRN
ncbi:hypothetical protein AJ79_07517 [Helicocarpus griseus UAMH5409]|uniref:Peptidase S8/S53 domain-containing protein n=1 Tax=Helicocarpus griseus UAMH5409 TaxID=1447875 RepID=A0A2B7X247_9EURO|nr:hypothetical protein AJ79_07517 [Helicocarpus griseus UAMH5409]